MPAEADAGHDSTDAIQIAELITLGELVVRARKAGVQVMVEGPGHMPLNDIRMNVEVAKKAVSWCSAVCTGTDCH